MLCIAQKEIQRKKKAQKSIFYGQKEILMKKRKIHPLKTVGGAHHRLLPFPNKANRRNRRRRLSLPLHSTRCSCRDGKISLQFLIFSTRKTIFFCPNKKFLPTNRQNRRWRLSLPLHSTRFCCRDGKNWALNFISNIVKKIIKKLAEQTSTSLSYPPLRTLLLLLNQRWKTNRAFSFKKLPHLPFMIFVLFL